MFVLQRHIILRNTGFGTLSHFESSTTRGLQMTEILMCVTQICVLH